MCTLDYDYHILSTPFLVHKKGIKTTVKANETIVKEQLKLIKQVVVPELAERYGKVAGCEI